MKILLYILLFSSSVYSEPKYKYGDHVKFNIKPFWSKQCENIGEIQEYFTEYSIVFYSIKSFCLNKGYKEFRVREDEIIIVIK